jgi:hypothetical protein
MLQHSIVVELAEIFDLSNTALQEAEVVLLKPEANGLNDIVDNADHEFGMVTVDGTQQDGQEMNAAILDLSGFGEHLLEYSNNLRGPVISIGST